MSREVHPVFTEVIDEELKAAEALSEPFVGVPENFIAISSDKTTPYKAENVVAMGVTYVDAEPDYGLEDGAELDDYADDEVGIRDKYFMRSDLAKPHCAFRAFVDGYRATVEPLYRRIVTVHQVVGQEVGEEMTDELVLDEAIDITMRAGMRTLGAFVLMKADEGNGYVHAILAPKYIADSAVEDFKEALTGGLIEDDEFEQFFETINKKTNPGHTEVCYKTQYERFISGDPLISYMHGLRSTVVILPRAEVAEKGLAELAPMRRYYGMERTELRKLLTTERKAEQKKLVRGE